MGMVRTKQDAPGVGWGGGVGGNHDLPLGGKGEELLVMPLLGMGMGVVRVRHCRRWHRLGEVPVLRPHPRRHLGEEGLSRLELLVREVDRGGSGDHLRRFPSWVLSRGGGGGGVAPAPAAEGESSGCPSLAADAGASCCLIRSSRSRCCSLSTLSLSLRVDCCCANAASFRYCHDLPEGRTAPAPTLTAPPGREAAALAAAAMRAFLAASDDPLPPAFGPVTRGGGPPEGPGSTTATAAARPPGWRQDEDDSSDPSGTSGGMDVPPPCPSESSW